MTDPPLALDLVEFFVEHATPSPRSFRCICIGSCIGDLDRVLNQIENVVENRAQRLFCIAQHFDLLVRFAGQDGIEMKQVQPVVLFVMHPAV